MIRLKSIGLFMLLVLLAGCAESGDEQMQPPVYLVRITTQDVVGSGVIYSVENGWVNVLTAAHVVENMSAARPAESDVAAMDTGEEDYRGAEITFYDGKKVFCRDILLSELADLAMLRISIAQFTDEELESYCYVPVDKESFDALCAEDVCTSVGFGPGGEVLRYEGRILEPWIYMEDYGQYMIWAGADIRSGMSAGGLLDQNGCLIGILSGGSEDGELAAVPYSLVLQFIETIENF